MAKDPYLKFSVVTKKADKQWVGLCLDLDVSSVGDTQREAEDNLIDAIISYLEYAHETDLKAERPVPLRALRDFLGPPPESPHKPSKSKKASIEEVSIPRSLLPSFA